MRVTACVTQVADRSCDRGCHKAPLRRAYDNVQSVRNGDGEMKAENRRREEFLIIKRIAIHTRSSSHDVVVTRLLSRISFLSRSFCLNCRLSSRELPSQQERGSRDARGRKTGRLRARVRKKDEARQAQTDNMAIMVLFSGHHCMAASVLLRLNVDIVSPSPE